MRRKTLSVAVFLLFAAAVFPSAEDVVEEIVAIVNDDIITLSQYREQHDALVQMLRAQLSGEEFEKQYDRLKNDLLNSMITDLLLLQMAKEKMLNVNEQVKLTIENIKKENHFDTDEDLKRELWRQGVVYEEWIKQMEETYLKQNVLFSEVDRHIVIDDSETVAYYKKRPEEFIEPEEYKLRAIYLSIDEWSGEGLEQKKKLINEKLASGEDMVVLAGEFSDGPGKESGGDLGVFKKGELEKTLEQEVEKLQAGELTPWIKVKNGWYLIRIEEKKESRLQSYEEAKTELEEKLYMEKKQKLLDEFLKKLRERSYIKILKPNPVG